MKIAAAVEYCGTQFSGWQRLKCGRSVQQCVEEALSFVANQPIHVYCAGRTDAGVHACFQIIHFETEVSRRMHSWVFGANANLPADVSLLWAMPVAEDFHARFMATARSYVYKILNRPERAGLFGKFLTWERQPLETAWMSEAARDLIGRHDFSSYRAQACQSKSPVREIYELRVERCGDYVTISVRANAFLYHMVRNIAGVLLAIGTGRETSTWAREVLEARNRAAAGITAPAQGLYLTNIEYPPRFGIPQAQGNGFCTTDTKV